MPKVWGKVVVNGGVVGDDCVRNFCCGFGGVDKPSGFMVVFSQTLLLFFHIINSSFLSVADGFFRTINTTNKDNNKLIKPILLLGGCV